MKIELLTDVGNHKKGATLEVAPYIAIKLVDLKSAKIKTVKADKPSK